MSESSLRAARIGRREFLGRSVAGAALAAGALGLAGGMAQAAPKRDIVKSLKFGMIAAEDASGKQLSVADRLKVAVDAGFTAVEPNTIFNAAELKEMADGAEKAGIKIDAFVCSTHWGSPLSAKDPAVYEKTIDGMKTTLQNAKDVGADMALLVPAVVNPETTYQEAWTRSVERTKQLAEEAERLGVTIGIENVWNKFLLSPLEGKQFIQDVGSDYVKFWFDVGNVVLFGYPQDWIRTLGSDIARVDVKDFDAGSKNFVPLMKGSVDWPEVMKAFDEIGYTGVFAAEVQGGDLAYLTEKVSKPMDAFIAM